ncbi:MAG: Undecaprenyl-diphosphatase, partial [uncultured Rubrobacteraceae bacterium]
AGAPTGDSARDRAGAHGVSARVELRAPLARSVLSRPRPGPLRALLRRSAAHGDARRGGLVLLARPPADGLRVLPVVLSPRSGERRRPAHGLPHHRRDGAGRRDRVLSRGFLRGAGGSVAVGRGLQFRPYRSAVHRRGGRRQADAQGLEARVRGGCRDRVRPGRGARAGGLAVRGDDNARALSGVAARGGGAVLLPYERADHCGGRQPEGGRGDPAGYGRRAGLSLRRGVRDLGGGRVRDDPVPAQLPDEPQPARLRLLPLRGGGGGDLAPAPRRRQLL